MIARGDPVPESADAVERARVEPGDPTGAALVVEGLAGAVLLQDLGRDLIASGVPVGGAFDRRAHRLALALVGNDPTEASLEIVGTVTVRARHRLLAAVTGTAQLHVGGPPQSPGTSGEPEPPGHAWHPVPAWTVLELADGEALRITTTGCAYLAVRGGLTAPVVLGSRSSCLLGPLGPAPVTRAQLIAVGERAPVDARAGDFCRPVERAGDVAVVVGPHGSWERQVVDVVDVSRIGVRLAPRAPALPHRWRSDLPSLGVLPGTIQALPAGEWMLLGPDAGTMGGYPVVGVLAGDGLDRWAHRRAGDWAELRAVPPGVTTVAGMEPIVRVGEIR